jgi:ribA/ribD-fused uncharacterized protein
MFGPREKQALFYEGRYYMFSNFSAFMFYWKDEWWMTSEHAYQASKFLLYEIKERIRTALSAHDAKKIARSLDHLKRADWASVKLPIMEEIVRAKLEQHPFIKESLLETRQMVIIEDSPKDSFWGRGPDHNGENHLGRIWMKLRDELTLGKYENLGK